MTASHIWRFVCLLSAGSVLSFHNPNTLYPSINDSVTLTCICLNHHCQRVLWYRLLEGNDKPEFILKVNQANAVNYNDHIEKTRFKTTVSEKSFIEYTLRIMNIQRKDAGFYSCVLAGPQVNTENLMPLGYYIRPGETAPTQTPPTVKPTTRPRPRYCPSASPKGCRSQVLWTGGATLLILFVVLILTLFYFSRLPKKCRHRFERKNQLR